MKIKNHFKNFKFNIKSSIALISCSVLIFATAAALVFTAAPAAAQNAPGAASKSPAIDAQLDLNYKNCVVIQKSYRLISIYWQSLEVLNQIKDPSVHECGGLKEKYDKLCGAMNALALEISGHILGDVSDNKDLRALKMFSALYKSKAIYERQPFYLVCTPVIKKIHYLLLNSPDELKISGFEILSAGEFEKQYFPGYGEADPFYYYRKGRELETEVIDTYWKEETVTYSKFETIQSEVTRECLFDMYDDDNIDIIEQQGPFEKIIDGVPVICYKVKFMTLATITTVSKKKYDLTRVWFELLRNKYSILMPSKWEVCGKTYEMHEFYTGCELILK
jgi:hypothetical protein